MSTTTSIETFAGAVEQRKKDGLTLDNRLVTIEQAVIAEASAERGVAVLTVRFEADIAAVTRNSARRSRCRFDERRGSDARPVDVPP